MTGGQVAHAPPLWEQALEELKLVVFYAALYLSVLRLGHEAPPALALLALGLSNLVLFTTVAIDFASPPWRAMASPTPTSSGCWPAGPCAASPSAPCSVSPRSSPAGS
ncbi:MAG: hypothetical protein R3F60_08015 [bacterium]